MLNLPFKIKINYKETVGGQIESINESIYIYQRRRSRRLFEPPKLDDSGDEIEDSIDVSPSQFQQQYAYKHDKIYI